LEDGKYVAGKEILISDTIGFIQDLPPTLIQAFKSTLAETVDADVILHVIDITDTQIHKKIEVVEEILTQLGVNNKPKIYAFNKIDLIDKSEIIPKIIKNEYKGIMKAGIETAKTLGWLNDEKTPPQKIPKPDIKNLKKKYKEFVPAFISAEEKLNLDELIKIIDQKITENKFKRD
jgi:GTP-binding protein HflX